MTSRTSFLLSLFLSFVCSTAILCDANGQDFDLPANFNVPSGQFDLPFAGESLSLGTAVQADSQSALEKRSPESREDLLEIQEAAITVAKKARECTVALQLGNAMGSGVVISEDGYILTAAHVVSEPGKEMLVKFPNGRLTRAMSLGLHTSADGALAKIMEDFEWPYAPLADKDEAAEPGDWCLAVGHPGGFDINRAPPVRLGRVIDVRSTVIRTDCPIMGGDSGGPLFDLEGRVIGIHSRIASDVTENLHVPSGAYHEAWDRMMDSKVYPVPVPSKFLSLLDADQDGVLEKEEMKTDYHRRVFERLVEEFDLDEEDAPIKSLVRNEFHWRSDFTKDIIEIDELDEVADRLQRRDYVRGPLMKHVVVKALRESDDRYRDSNADYVNDLTVRVYVDGRRVALGTIVDQDGLILTKASRLEDDDDIRCRMPDGTRRDAKIVSVDDGYDLALLQVAANDLSAPIWNMSSLDSGRVVVLPENGGDVDSIGVIAVPPREIAPIPARMGVRLAKNSPILRVEAVFEGSGAEQAGMAIGDVIVNVAGNEVDEFSDIINTLNEYRAGDEVPITVIRSKKETTFNVRLLAEMDIFFPLFDNWQMSGPISRRRDGFESAFQVDAVIKPQSCGGPVVDLNGHLLGVTLARASRVATYAIGTKELQPILNEMRSRASAITTTRLDTGNSQTAQ